MNALAGAGQHARGGADVHRVRPEGARGGAEGQDVQLLLAAQLLVNEALADRRARRVSYQGKRRESDIRLPDGVGEQRSPQGVTGVAPTTAAYLTRRKVS